LTTSTGQIPPEPPHGHVCVAQVLVAQNMECGWRTHQGLTKPHQIVFDPFAGSGVVAIEAARNKRRAIVCDLNPIASCITDLTLRRWTH